VYARRLFNVMDLGADEHSLSFELTSLSTLPEPPCGETKRAVIGARPSPRVPTVTHLHLACWAFDAKHIIGATQLLAVALEDLPQFSRLPVETCDASDTEGRACLTRTACAVEAPSEVQSTDGGAGGTPDGGTLPEGPGEVVIGTCRAAVCVAPPCTGTTTALGFLSVPLVVGECDVENTVTNAENCFPDPYGTIGTCWDSECRSRCLTDEDCRLASVGADPAEPNLSCSRRRGDAALGLCLEVRQ
jgi:hypothetical protein